MKIMSKISVIVPTYNVKDYLQECMDSILSQSLKDIEVICIDDGSTDGSSEILDKYAAKDPRVKVYHNENGGYGKAMNFGLSVSSGEYVGIVEPDDYIESSMFEELYAIAEENDLDWIKSNFKRFYGEIAQRSFEDVPLTNRGEYYGRVIVPVEEPDILKLTMNIWTGIYRRKFIMENQILFNETPGASFQDNGFWIQTLVLAKRVYFKDAYYYMNRRDNPNSSVKNTEKAMCVIEEFRYIDNFLDRHQDLREYFISYYVLCKLIGYISIFGRSSRMQQFAFINEASVELKKHMDAGEIVKDLYGPVRWRALNDIISDPIQYFINQNSAESTVADTEIRGLLRQTQENLIDIQNKYANLPYETADFLGGDDLCAAIKVSVVIPVHNMVAYLPECLQSVLSQSLKEIEVLCVNDGSTDNSFEVIMYYKRLDSRIKLLNQIESGAGVARNAALDIARGEFIAFMDADDWYPDIDVLKKLYESARQNRVNICGGSMCAYKDGELLEAPEYYSFSNEGYVNYTEYQEIYGYTRYIYSRDLIEKAHIRFPRYIRFQDPVFFVQAMAAAGVFYSICDITYVYRKGHKRTRWTEQQCADLLNGLNDLLIFSVANDYNKIKESILDRITGEYVSFYSDYLCRHSVKVAEEFGKIVAKLDAVEVNRVLGAVFDYMARKYVIPKRKLDARVCELEEDNRKLLEEAAKEKEKVEKCERQISDLNYHLYHTRISFTYRIGRLITFLPRTVRRLFGYKGEV